MHSAIQTAVVTIISYKPLSGLNFARHTGQYGSYMPSSHLGVYKPLVQCSIEIIKAKASTFQLESLSHTCSKEPFFYAVLLSTQRQNAM